MVYKERCHATEVIVTDGAQPDGMPVGEVGTIAEDGLGFPDEGYLVTMNFFYQQQRNL